MHLLNGFDSLIGQDALQHSIKELPNLNLTMLKLKSGNSVLDTPYLSYFIQDNVKRFFIHVFNQTNVRLFVNKQLIYYPTGKYTFYNTTDKMHSDDLKPI